MLCSCFFILCPWVLVSALFEGADTDHMRQETLPPLLTITHQSPDAPAVTCAALSEDGVRLMSGVAAGRCIGAPPATLGSGLVTVVATQL